MTFVLAAQISIRPPPWPTEGDATAELNGLYLLPGDEGPLQGVSSFPSFPSPPSPCSKFLALYLNETTVAHSTVKENQNNLIPGSTMERTRNQ